MAVVPVLAVIVAALALYASRAVLDQVITTNGLVRVAMLPPWQSIGGFVALGLLGLLWLDRRATPRATATAVRPALGPLLLPMFGVLLLLLPYLPILPDAFPALQILAGPLRTVVWIVTLTQLLWVLWQVRLVRADWLQRASLSQLAAAAALATALIGGVAAANLTNTTHFPGGDEPHYLVIAQSLWRDGDLKIENNHTRRDYSEYFPRDLDPHYLTRGKDGEIYSIHPIGMPVLIAPIYALGGYPAVVALFVAMAAIAAGLIWLTVMRATNSAGAATFAWSAVAVTSPFLLNAFTVYPEIPAALAAVVAFFLISQAASPGWWRWLAVGIACAVLPWLSTKYAPMSAALMAVAVGRMVGATGAIGAGATGARPSGAGTAFALVAPYGISLLGWFYFFNATWGSPLPQAPYGKMVQTDLKNLVFGAPGLIFDQEYGLLPYAPVYLLAATGLWAMWRRDAESRRIALEIALIFAALLGTVGAFRIWWGGSAAPSRPLTSGLLLLALPIGFAFHAAPAGSARRAGQALLLWTSIGVTALLLFAERGGLLFNDREGTSRLLEYLSPRWPLWSIAPSFIYHEAADALLHTGCWVLLAAAVALIVRRIRAAHPGAVSLGVMGVAALAAAAALAIMPALPLRPSWPQIDVRARARVPLVDRFDPVARPIAIEYTPLHAEPAAEAARQASFEVIPGLRTDPQPIRVVHNGRFSLPAGGYRLEVDWNGARDGESLGLQIGRTGSVWRSWPVQPRPGERWSTEFTLPLDMSFVGLRGSPELERLVQHARLIPITLLDEGRRPRTAEVIGASLWGSASVFYYDMNQYQEAEGFWVRQARTTHVAIHHPEGSGPLVLRVHSGPRANTLRMTSFGWDRTVYLQPHKRTEIEVPVGPGRLVRLDLAALEGFVPHEIDSASTDHRALGVWVEVAQ